MTTIPMTDPAPRRYFGGIRLRFAISPTGNLVLNAARIALANALFAQERGARLTLRIDDLNPERSRTAFSDAIIHDLAALGVTWDGTLRQSERVDRYATAIEALKLSGRLYPCFESEAELRAKAEHRRKRGRATIYDRAMLSMTAAQRAAAEAGGKVPYWRFRLSDGFVVWRDMILGKRDAKLTAISDPVLVLANGTVAPVLASVVDDLDLAITHVIRGEENAADAGVYLDVMTCLKPLLPAVPSTSPPPLEGGGRGEGSSGTDGESLPLPPTPSLQGRGGSVPRTNPDALAHTPNRPLHGGEIPVTGPRFANIPPIDSTPSAARKLGSQPLRQTLADGILPAALIAWLTGRDPNATTPFSLDSMERIPTPDTLLRLNRKVLARTEFPAIADRLPTGATEAFWLAIRAHIELVADAATWWDIVTADIVPVPSDIAAQALAELPAEPWDDTTWGAWTAALGPTAKPGLFLALTGEETGPAMDRLLPMIGRDRVIRRLRAT